MQSGQMLSPNPILASQNAHAAIIVLLLLFNGVTHNIEDARESY